MHVWELVVVVGPVRPAVFPTTSRRHPQDHSVVKPVFLRPSDISVLTQYAELFPDSPDTVAPDTVAVIQTASNGGPTDSLEVYGPSRPD